MAASGHLVSTCIRTFPGSGHGWITMIRLGNPHRVARSTLDGQKSAKWSEPVRAELPSLDARRCRQQGGEAAGLPRALGENKQVPRRRPRALRVFPGRGFRNTVVGWGGWEVSAAVIR